MPCRCIFISAISPCGGSAGVPVSSARRDVSVVLSRACSCQMMPSPQKGNTTKQKDKAADWRALQKWLISLPESSVPREGRGTCCEPGDVARRGKGAAVWMVVAAGEQTISEHPSGVLCSVLQAQALLQALLFLKSQRCSSWNVPISSKTCCTAQGCWSPFKCWPEAVNRHSSLELIQAFQMLGPVWLCQHQLSRGKVPIYLPTGAGSAAWALQPHKRETDSVTHWTLPKETWNGKSVEKSTENRFQFYSKLDKNGKLIFSFYLCWSLSLNVDHDQYTLG